MFELPAMAENFAPELHGSDFLTAAPAILPGVRDELSLIQSARSAKAVEGLTHTHYRYPARFSPILISELIKQFTDPGDLVLDPFVGGGTTVIEAMAAQRRATGLDISTLANFVATAKTLVPEDAILVQLESWAQSGVAAISMHRAEPQFPDWSDAGYFRHMSSSSRWRLRKAISQAVAQAANLEGPLQALARLVVLRTAQWALDSRKVLPTINEFRAALKQSAALVVRGTRDLSTRVGSNPVLPKLFNRSATTIGEMGELREDGPPKLIVTSPPYPGVHVLYHRWQVDGRKESAAPFFIANSLDGSGEAYYTMGGRSRPGLETYFEQLAQTMCGLANLADNQTIMVQVIAFAQPVWQLHRYLKTCSENGWEEFGLSSLSKIEDGRLWRKVPNRKWYADQRGRTHGSHEVVLFHKLAH